MEPSTRSLLRHIQIVVLNDERSDDLEDICEFERFCYRALPYCDSLQSLTLRFDADNATLFAWADHFGMWPIKLLGSRNIRMMIKEEGPRGRHGSLLYYACHDLIVREPKIAARPDGHPMRPCKLPIRWMVPIALLDECRAEYQQLERDDAFLKKRFRSSFLSGLEHDHYETSFPGLMKLPEIRMVLLEQELSDDDSHPSYLSLWEMTAIDDKF